MQRKSRPNQKKPVFGPQPHAEGFSMYGVQTLLMMPMTLYAFRDSTMVLVRRRVEESSATRE